MIELNQSNLCDIVGPRKQRCFSGGTVACHRNEYDDEIKFNYKRFNAAFVFVTQTRNINDWICLNKFDVDSVYLDFAKAFDTVSHIKLLTKLTG